MQHVRLGKHVSDVLFIIPVFLKLTTAVIRRLVGAGAAVDIRDARGCTAVHCAARSGSAFALRILLLQCDKGVVDILTSEGVHALHWAVVSGSAPAVETVLKHCNSSCVNVATAAGVHNHHFGVCL